jgi:hypothetical protein
MRFGPGRSLRLRLQVCEPLASVPAAYFEQPEFFQLVPAIIRLVKTGTFRPVDLEGAIRPHAIFDSVSDLPRWWGAARAM